MTRQDASALAEQPLHESTLYKAQLTAHAAAANGLRKLPPKDPICSAVQSNTRTQVLNLFNLFVDESGLAQLANFANDYFTQNARGAFAEH